MDERDLVGESSSSHGGTGGGGGVSGTQSRRSTKRHSPSGSYRDSFNLSSGDSNHWQCSVCTFINAADAFTCNMCDTRKGTSTRKPRLNTDNIVAQVVRQQEEIRQQAIKAGKRKSNDNFSDNESINSGRGLSPGAYNTPHKPKKSPKSLKIEPISGNLFKSQPPLYSGRSDFFVDKRRYVTNAVTANNVTVTFTEYATRKRTPLPPGSRSFKRTSSRKKTSSKASTKHATPANDNSDYDEDDDDDDDDDDEGEDDDDTDEDDDADGDDDVNDDDDEEDRDPSGERDENNHNDHHEETSNDRDITKVRQDKS